MCVHGCVCTGLCNFRLDPDIYFVNPFLPPSPVTIAFVLTCGIPVVSQRPPHFLLSFSFPSCTLLAGSYSQTINPSLPSCLKAFKDSPSAPKTKSKPVSDFALVFSSWLRRTHADPASVSCPAAAFLRGLCLCTSCPSFPPAWSALFVHLRNSEICSNAASFWEASSAVLP